eukprot:jgi/Mesvir1/3274/Mv16406-RA.1
MPRSVLADEDVLRPYVESLLRCRATFEIGLLIGRAATSASSRDYLVGLVRAPPQVGGDNSRRSATYPVDADWISEHGRQLSRMLPGGLAVLGAYVYVPDAIFKAKLPEVVHALQALKESCGPASGRPAPLASGISAVANAAAPGKSVALGGEGTEEMLALHISAETGKFTAKSCTPQEARPCEFKMGKVLASFTALTSGYQVALSVPLLSPSPSGAATTAGSSSTKKASSAAARRTLHSHLGRLLAQEEARLRDAVLAVGGVVPSETEQVLTVVEREQAQADAAQAQRLGGCSPLEPALTLQVFAPLPSAAALDEWKGALSKGGDEGVLEGQLEVRGSVRALAYVHNREPFARAADSIKADILATLRVRLDVLCEELERRAEEEEEERQAREGNGAGDKGASQKGGAAGAVGGAGASTSSTKVQHPLLATVQQLNASAQPLFCPLPRRAFVKYRGGLHFCDYLLEDEAVQDVEERCREVLDLETAADMEAMDNSVVMWIEGVPRDSLGREAAGAIEPPPPSAEKMSVARRSTGFLVAAAGAVGVAVAAVATTLGLEYLELTDVL